MTFAAGCATTEPVTRTETVYEKPPESLFPVCKTPDHVTETNGDLARAYNDMRSALEECRSGMEAVKEWPDGLESETH